MLIVFLVSLAIGIVVAIAWLWRRTLVQTRECSTGPPPRPALQREDGSADSVPSPPTREIPACDERDDSERKGTLGTRKAPERVSASETEKDRQYDPALQTRSYDRSVGTDETAQRHRGVDLRHTDTQVETRSHDGQDSDKSSEESVTQGAAHTRTDEADGAKNRSADAGSGESGDGVVRAGGENRDERGAIHNLMAQAGKIREEVPEEGIQTDSEQHDARVDRGTAKGASEDGLDGPAGAAIIKRPESSDTLCISEEQRRGNNEDLVGDEDATGHIRQAEPEESRSRSLPRRMGHPGSGAWRESDGRVEPKREDFLTTDRESASPLDRKKKASAVYRDRRGVRRAVTHTPRPSLSSEIPAAEARLRLVLDPVQRSARISVSLMRPQGFPDRIHPLLDGEDSVEAFDISRYDELHLSWTADLLDEELRIRSREGQQWLRTARPVHIFSESPAESGMISVGAAKAGVYHALVCRDSYQEAVRAAAVSTGSPGLVSHEHWQGIPDGWAVLSGYCPSHATRSSVPEQFSPLDPGNEVAISLSGGLAIQATVYAEGRPPRIGVVALPVGASVTIGGIPAREAPDGAWEADGWDSPGDHLIDIVPGPSLSYQIMADPAATVEWQFWDAHPERFGAESSEPWGRAMICGTAVRGVNSETVVVAASLPILIALGERRHAVPLKPRSDVPGSVALMREAPSFLVAATGMKRKQGRIVWLGSTAKRRSGISPNRRSRETLDRQWAEIVRSVAARRLRLEGADPNGELVWRDAKQRARRIWRRQ